MPDRGARRKDDQIRGLQASGQRIEIGEAGPDAADLAPVRVQVIEPVERVVEKLLEGRESGGETPLRDRVELRLGPVDRLLDLRGVLVPDPGDPPRGRDQVPQDRLALHDPGVLRREDRRRRLLGQRGEVAASADRLELSVALERLGDRDDVDRLTALPQVHHDAVDLPVRLSVEVDRAKDVRDLDDRVAVDEKGAEDGLLGLEALRRKAVDGHVDSGLASGAADMVTRGPAGRE